GSSDRKVEAVHCRPRRDGTAVFGMKNLALIAACLCLTVLASCSKPPSKLEYVGKGIECLMRYCTNDAAGAEAAMLEWENHIRECQRAHIRRVDFDLDYAQVYSRLYLVEKHLGKNDAAEAYFRESL